MNQRLLRAALAVGIAGLAASSLAAAPANAATVVQVRPADLITSLTDVRSAGHYDFLAEGIHVKTDDASSNAKVALYFPVTGALPTSGSIEWYGTTAQPGVQIVFDKDQTAGNSNDDNLLVGEQHLVHEPGRPAADRLVARREAPAKAATIGHHLPVDHPAAPVRTATAPWRSGRLPCRRRRSTPAASRSAAGSRATGSCAPSTLGGTSYVFTDAPKTTVTVTAEAKSDKVKEAQERRRQGHGDPRRPGAKVTLELKKNGKWKTVETKDLGGVR